MEIKIEKSEGQRVRIDSLSPGDAFVFDGDYFALATKGRLHSALKNSYVTTIAVSLESSLRLTHFSPQTLVRPVNALITVSEKL